MFFKRYQIK